MVAYGVQCRHWNRKRTKFQRTAHNKQLKTFNSKDSTIISFDTSSPLSTLTTMRLGGLAKHVIELTEKEELINILRSAQAENLKYFVLGGGSNVIAPDEGYDGILILNKLKGFEIISDDENHMTIKIAAGENWDETVARTVKLGLSGIEAMSAIPGSVGATPVQNVGAYGQEIADTLIEIEAYDIANSQWVILQNSDCHFSYRSSVFKNPATRQHIITSITLRLSKEPMQPPFYASLGRYFSSHDIRDFSPSSIRTAVTAIRSTKLPDPKLIANTGSFFKNPIVEASKARELKTTHPNMPQFPMKNGTVKIAAGWLIESAEMKGYRKYGFRTYENNALVIVNESSHSYLELEKFRHEIVSKVESLFGISLEQEPELLTTH